MEARTFTKQEFEAYLQRAATEARIDVVDKLIKRTETIALELFQSRDDKGAAAVRDFSDELLELKHVYGEGLARLASNERKAEMLEAADEIADAGGL